MNTSSVNQDVVQNDAGWKIEPAGYQQAPLAGAQSGNWNVATYPEVYYKVLPHIMEACDQLDAVGANLTKDMTDNVSERLKEEILRMHPELASYQGPAGMPGGSQEAREAISYGFGYGAGPGYGYYSSGIRTRGFLRDLIDILLMREFYRRRRCPYCYW